MLSRKHRYAFRRAISPRKNNVKDLMLTSPANDRSAFVSLPYLQGRADHRGAIRRLSLGVARESRHIFLSRRLPGVCTNSHYEIYYCSLIDRFPLLPSSSSSLSRTTPLLAPGTSKSAVVALRCVVSSHIRKGDRLITLAGGNLPCERSPASLA